MTLIKAFDFQKNVLDDTADRNRVAYYLDMGLGKTFVGGEKARQLKTHVLVVCQKSKLTDWYNHLVDECNYDTYDLTDKKELNYYAQCLNGGNEIPVAGIINYDLIFRRDIFLQLRGYTLILDESSLIQNDTIKRTKFILKMNPLNVILLSGTPTSGKYENLWSQAQLLRWNISKRVYNTQYVNWTKIDVDGVPIKIVDKENPYRNIKRLKQKFRENGAVFLKTDEVFDLPEQNFITVHIPTTKLYERFQKSKYVTVDGDELIGDTTLSFRIHSRMLCGHYNFDKLNAFRDLLSSTNDRLIVFYNYDKELALLRQIALDLDKPVSEINGHIKDLTAYDEDENSVTLVQYQAGSKGQNLQKANKIIYFTPTDKCEDWQQSIKRIHRIGQYKSCFYYQLICTDSIEEDIYKALQRGVDYTDYLFEEGKSND
jgi:SNF2 family DNA or RNA helicase